MVRKILVSAMLVIIIVSLAACVNPHGIPNGYYRHCNVNGDIIETDGYYWYIRGNTAEYYATAMSAYRCKIVVEDDRLFFEFDGEKYKDAFKFEVEYDESSKLLTIHSEEYSDAWSDYSTDGVQYLRKKG